MLGLINLLKPTGLTSSDCVGRVKWLIRRHFNDKSIRVGHLGTLDPLGAGVLPIVLGKATRLFDYCQYGEKTYRATFVFKSTTDTLDSDGVVVATSDVLPDLEMLTTIIPEFVGKIMQIPPQYSSISVGGVRGYQAARRGIELAIQPREVEIYSITIVSYVGNDLQLDIHCKGGVYIRSLARDIAARLSTCAYMSSIIRLENKGLKIEDSVTLAELEENIESHILSIDCMIGALDIVELDGDDAFHLLNGVAVAAREIVGDYKVMIDGDLYGVCRDKDNVVDTVIRLWDRL